MPSRRATSRPTTPRRCGPTRYVIRRFWRAYPRDGGARPKTWRARWCSWRRLLPITSAVKCLRLTAGGWGGRNRLRGLLFELDETLTQFGNLTVSGFDSLIDPLRPDIHLGAPPGRSNSDQFVKARHDDPNASLGYRTGRSLGQTPPEPPAPGCP